MKAGQIFISYTSADRERIQPLVQALERRGWSVWWDRKIPPGRTFDDVIEAAIDASSCVIVVWSEKSVSSEWVRTEAGEGRQRGILIPVLIDDVKIPLAFRRIEAAQLAGWDGVSEHPELDSLLESVARLVGPPPGRAAEKVAAQRPAAEEAEAKRSAAERTEPEPELSADVADGSATLTTSLADELHPSLALTMSVESQTVDAGDEARWKVRLRNGDDNLRGVIVRRSRTLLEYPFDLAAGEERRFTFTTTYEAEREQTEKVTATGVASNGETVRDEASATVQVRPADRLTIASPIQLELVRVPAGEFLMGSDKSTDKEADDDENPQHRVHVSEFYIGSIR